MMDFLANYTLGVVTGGFVIALFLALRKVFADAWDSTKKGPDNDR